ncbi:MAG: hypothetical protein MUW57_14315 [Pseudomonas sp.]|nr:hypothetical protein [Pseudomonas sp.]
MKKLSAVISSPLDRENIVFEIWFEARQVAEVSHEPDCPIEIEIYPAPEGETWKFDLDEFKAVLEKAIINLK